MPADDFIATLPQLVAAKFRETDSGDELQLQSWTEIFPQFRGGWISLVFNPEALDGPVTLAQLSAVENLLREEQVYGARLASALKLVRPKFVEAFGAEFVPDEAAIAGAIVPLSLFVHSVDEGEPLLGIELNCDWDREHGLGILMRGGEVLGVCSADAAFVRWMAREAAKGAYDFSYWRG